MDAIRLYSAQVPDQVKKVVRILVEGTEKDVEDLVPIELIKIDRNASECLHLAQAVEAKFEHEMDLTGELLQVSSAAKRYYQQTQEEVKIQREVALEREESAREKISLAKEQQKELKKQVKDAKAAWEKAVDSMPSGWDLAGMQFVETITNTLSNCAKTLLPHLAFGAMMKAWSPSPAGMHMLAGAQMPEQIPAKTGRNPYYTPPPRLARSMAGLKNSNSSSVAKSVAENARFKIAEARGRLEAQQNRYHQVCKELGERNEELITELQNLAELSLEKIANFDQIRETLIQGLKALASVREQWQKLVEFFQFITNIIKVCQKESLASFVEYAKVGRKRVLANGYADTDFMRDLIYEQVSEANTTSYLVWSISHVYVEISRKHLMSPLASLGHLIALDPEKERHTIEAKRNELMKGSEEAQEAIRKYVSEAKKDFHEKVTEGTKQIETELLKALPSEDPAKIKEINDSVKSAIKEGDDELGADNF